MYYAVIGNNYGDEGKGLAVDHLTLSGHNLVVRHNGGAQAAHTVDREDKRFVFHELSSGSFNGADTYWASTFLPDLYKLEEEINKGSQAQAVVTEMVYAGTIFVIDGIVYRADSDRKTYDKLTFKADALRENIIVIEG